MIKTVIFDVDNTLYNYDSAHEKAITSLSAYAEKELKLPRTTLEDLIKKAFEEQKKYMGNIAAIHNRTIRFQYMLENRGLPLHPHVLKMDEIYWETLLEAAVPSDGAASMMEALKAKGIRIGIGTDMTARMQFRKLTALGLLSYVDFFISSEEVGVEKPEARFFSRCLTKAGCNKEECLFVGDSLKKDVYGAINAGFKAVWYCPKGNQTKTDVLQISNMMQLVQIVFADNDLSKYQ